MYGNWNVKDEVMHRATENTFSTIQWWERTLNSHGATPTDKLQIFKPAVRKGISACNAQEENPKL